MTKMLHKSTDAMKEAGAGLLNTARQAVVSTVTGEQDAVSVLKAQHREVEALFKRVLESEDPRVRKDGTREIIQADAEDQLKRSGLRVRGQGATPALYFQISVLCDDTDPCAIDVSSAAIQDVFLEAMATAPIRAARWTSIPT